jgi:hypothetical protein
MAGCSTLGEPASATTIPDSGENALAGTPAAVLKITGKVADEKGWSEEQIRAMETIEVTATNQSGNSEAYTGVLMMNLLAMVGVQPDANTVIFVGGDGQTALVPLSDVQDCADCIFTFRRNGGFSVLVPAVSENLLLKGVVEVHVE